MIRIIITILLVGAFFILFFKPKYDLKNKTVSEPSTTKGFVEDTHRGPILFGRDGIPPRYGDIGTFVAYSGVPEEHWLNGFPQDPSTPESYEDSDTKLSRRIRDLSK
jgi:hypothetical protein